MLTFNYGSPYFWDKVVLTKFISGCHMVWDLICGTSWFYKSKTEKVTGGGMSAILPNWCCLLSITVPFTHPWLYLNQFWLHYCRLRTILDVHQPCFWWNRVLTYAYFEIFHVGSWSVFSQFWFEGITIFASRHNYWQQPYVHVYVVESFCFWSRKMG